jgi:hypothetical protein
MQAASLSVVEDTPEVLKMRLKRAWEAIEQRKHAGEVTYDVDRAQALKEFLGEGMTQRQIGECVGISHVFIGHLLRYGRFTEFMVARATINSPPISEKAFRRYWTQTVEKSTIALLGGKGRRAKGNTEIQEYEQQVFQHIADKIEQGVKPQVHKTARKKTIKDLTTDDLEEFQEKLKHFKVIQRKEVREIYKRIEEDVRDLIQLSGCSRSTYAPGTLAMHAKRLREGFIELQRVLRNGDVDDWIMSVLQS